MNSKHYIFISVVLISLYACKHQKKDKPLTSDLKVDHLNIWIKNPKQAKEKLTNIGFTAVPDSLSKIHTGQGTTGRYFYFLNTYLELIFVYNQQELEQNNKINKDLDFTKRANFDKNGALPFSIALKVKDYDVSKIPFEKIKYHQDWMEQDVNIYAAKNSKTNLKEPSIFVVYPKIQYDVFETIEDLKQIPEEYKLWREFYKHPNGAKKVTKIVITTKDADLHSETLKAVNGIEKITVKNGETYLMELYFDNNIQKKSFDLRPGLPLIIHL